MCTANSSLQVMLFPDTVTVIRVISDTTAKHLYSLIQKNLTHAAVHARTRTPPAPVAGARANIYRHETRNELVSGSYPFPASTSLSFNNRWSYRQHFQTHCMRVFACVCVCIFILLTRNKIKERLFLPETSNYEHT